MTRLSQVAAIPVRSNGKRLEVMLVTSRETHRWVVPKGWPLRKAPDYKAAALEAWEEGGVRGKIGHEPLGRFTYDKRSKTGKILAIAVDAYVLEVREEAQSWPEDKERERAWFTPQAAARAVCEPELKRLLRALSKPANETAPIASQQKRRKGR